MADADIPFIFDPGQGLPLFSGDELIEMIDKAKYLAVNDYEARLLTERTGLALADIAARVDALIVTLGGDGSRIYTDGFVLDVPSVEPAAVIDPTGCGDAYRAGLLYGIAHGWDWQRTGRLASILGSVKIASRGGQNHAVDRDQLAALYAKRFGGTLW
jgi:adenosine kinase